jgi:hypothetical protein
VELVLSRSTFCKSITDQPQAINLEEGSPSKVFRSESLIFKSVKTASIGEAYLGRPLEETVLRTLHVVRHLTKAAMSGGAGSKSPDPSVVTADGIHVQLTYSELDIRNTIDLVKRDDAGAVVTFVGNGVQLNVHSTGETKFANLLN